MILFGCQHLYRISCVCIVVYTLTKIFNDHYINIVEKSSGKKPTNLATEMGIENDHEIVNQIIKDTKTILALKASRQS